MNAAAVQHRNSRLRRSTPGTSAAKAAAYGTALALALLAAGCARPVGDLGRVQGTFDHEVAMPLAGKGMAALRGEPVSAFNLSDQEKLMHNRVWRFLVSQHSHDWFYDTAAEFARTRLTKQMDYRFRADRYYNWLHRTDYASSRVRYATIRADIDADIATLPDTFAAICAVVEVDRQRALSAATLPDIEPRFQNEVWARKAENDMFIGWFVRAVRYRFDSYGYALDHLLVETPHEEARAADARLAVLETYVRRAEAYDFCGGSSVTIRPYGNAEVAPRVLMGPDISQLPPK